MTMRYWRNAASLIVVARSTLSQLIDKSVKDTIRIAKSIANNGNTYKPNVQGQVELSQPQILMLKRSGRSGFFPNAYVFPGGVIELADSSQKWIDLYKDFGFQQSDFEKLNVLKGQRPPIFQTSSGEGIPREVSLRISAIRETFEECGLLLCRKISTISESSRSKWATFVTGDHLITWRHKVKKNPGMFLEMCKHLKCYPDIWNIFEWSDWLTPSDIKPRRFDTVFFIACINDTPQLTEDVDEVSLLEFNTPHKFLQAAYKNDLYLPPVQLYELSRLAVFQTTDEILSFSVDRCKEGIEMWMPVRINAENGVLSLLPGDDLYPDNPDFEGKTPVSTLDSSLEDLREQSQSHHRFEFTSPLGTLFVNIKQKHKHIGPIKFTDISAKL